MCHAAILLFDDRIPGLRCCLFSRTSDFTIAVPCPPDIILNIGMNLAGFQPTSRVQQKTKVNRFVNWFGAKPENVSDLWQKLQTTTIEEAKLTIKECSIGTL